MELMPLRDNHTAATTIRKTNRDVKLACMSESGDPIDPQLRALCPRVCVQCDYALEGLPVGVVCPECGLVEDPSVLTVRGWERPPLSVQSHARKAVTIALWSVSAAFVCWFAYLGRFDHLFYVLIAVNLLPSLYRWAQPYIHVVEGPPLRLRLSAAGFEQRIGPGPLNFRPWEPELEACSKAYSATLRLLRTKWAGGSFAYRGPERFFNLYVEVDADGARAMEQCVNRWIAAAPPVPSILSCGGFAVGRLVKKLRP